MVNGSGCGLFVLINKINDGGDVMNDGVVNAGPKRVDGILGLLGHSKLFDFGQVQSMCGIFVTDAPSRLDREYLSMNNESLPSGRELG